MTVLGKWLLRFKYLTFLIGLFIVTGNFVYLIQTGNIDKILRFYLYFYEKFQIIKEAFLSLNQHEFSNVVLAIVLTLFALGLYRYNKVLLLALIVIVCIGLFIVFVYYPRIVSFIQLYYYQNHGFIAFFAVLLLLFVGRLLLFTKSGRSFLLSLLRFTFEMYIALTVIYYIGTLQFKKIAQFFYLIWSEFSFSVHYLSFYIDTISIVFIAITVLLINFSTISGVMNYLKRRKELRSRGFTSDEILPHIGITIPAYNEEGVIVSTVKAALEADYPSGKKDILVICDGSQDGTCQKLIETFDMYQVLGDDRKPFYNWIRTKPVTGVWVSSIYPNLRVIYKLNGGKHDALNCGLNFHRKEVSHVMNLDADTLLEKDSIRKLAVEIARNKKELLAVAGTILPEYRSQSANSFKDWLIKMKTKGIVEWQRLDYLTSFHVFRGSLALLNAIFIISGAFGLFNRHALLSLMGYRKGLGEDMDVTLKLQSDRLKRKKGKIIYVPEAIAFTAAPLTLKELAGQRIRWFKGLLECLYRFRSLLFSKLIFTYLHFLLVEFLTPILIPIGVLNVLVRPETLLSPMFQCAIASLILSSVISTLTSIWLESRYRPIKKHFPFFLLTQIIITPLTFIWRNDAFLQYKDKSWGFIKKSFH